jgi:tetratricopeptide (TPR) repeat protein
MGYQKDGEAGGPPHPILLRKGESDLRKMNRLLLALTICFFTVAGCGLGVSEHKDAVLDGLSNLNRGKPEEALEDFNRAISIDPNHTDGYLGRANTLNTLGRYEESLKDYARVIEINPEIANAYVNRAIAYSHLKEYEKAIADYERAFELDPELDDSPGFLERIFSNRPNTDRGIRRHMEYLKEQVQKTQNKS